MQGPRRLERSKSLRQKRRRKDARLNRHQIKAAYELYKAGWSVPQIVAQGWRAWGFASPHEAGTSLYRAFALDGLPRRTLAEVRMTNRCAACGCKADERTVACNACRQRHWRRKIRGLPYLNATRGHVCTGCGAQIDQRTPGCRQCTNRHGRRNRLRTDSIKGPGGSGSPDACEVREQVGQKPPDSAILPRDQAA